MFSGTADGFVKSYTFDLVEGIKEISSVNLERPIYSLDTSESYHICALDSRRIQVWMVIRFTGLLRSYGRY